MRYHLDSSACVALLRLPTGKVPSALNRWRLGETGVSSIVAAGLEVGVYKSAQAEVQRAHLNLFFAYVQVDVFDHAAARHYGQIRAELEATGSIIGPMDLLIAAHARCVGATLITANVREFRRVKGLKITVWH